LEGLRPLPFLLELSFPFEILLLFISSATSEFDWFIEELSSLGISGLIVFRFIKEFFRVLIKHIAW
jgi:hypothetical protein